MDEPRTHYQLSFTVRQGLLLFVALLCALGVAYALGLMTGLAGRGSASPASSAAFAATPPASTPVPAATSPAADLELPRPIRGVAAGPGSRSSAPVSGSARRPAEPAPTAVAAVAVVAPGPTPSPGLQLFEDEAANEPTPVASHAGAVKGEKGDKTVSARKTPTDAGTSAAKGTAHPADSSSSFWVQAALASTEKEAHAQRDRLTAHGYSVVVVPGPAPAPGSNTRRVFRVRVGPYPNREAADRAAARLKTREKLRPWVVPPGK